MGDPSPQSEHSELLRRVRRLELIGRRNVAGRLAGAWATSFKGGGLLFEEPRKYVPGDPVRRLDWNLTARAGEPYVRVYREERQREVVLAVDVSPSMHTGFGRRTKLETAVELAASLAVSAVDAGDRLGLLLWADRVLAEKRPRAGRRRLTGVLAALLEHTAPWRRPVAVSDPRQAIHALERRRGAPRIVFLISDFLDADVPDDLAYLRARHDVTLLEIFDRFETDGGESIVFPARSPEGEPRPGPCLPAGNRATAEGERGALAEACGRLRIVRARISTDDDVPAVLARLFHHKRRRTVG